MIQLSDAWAAAVAVVGIAWALAWMCRVTSPPPLGTADPELDDDFDRVTRSVLRLRDERSELISSLSEIVEYEGGADNALEDEDVMERARELLARVRGGAK